MPQLAQRPGGASERRDGLRGELDGALEADLRLGDGAKLAERLAEQVPVARVGRVELDCAAAAFGHVLPATLREMHSGQASVEFGLFAVAENGGRDATRRFIQLPALLRNGSEQVLRVMVLRREL